MTPQALSRSALLGLVLMTGLTAGVPAKVRPQTSRTAAGEADDAAGRRAWNRYWFGDVTPDYLAFKNRAAAREVARWRASFPHSTGPLRQAAAPGGPTWTNLGPTLNTVNSYSASNSDIDSGRPVSVVVDPTNSQIVYLATSGGGVWKATNADTTPGSPDWNWTPITDALPASGATGNVSCGALAMSPTDHLTLYLGLGDAFDAAGTGVYVTHDGGSTWTAATINGATPKATLDLVAMDANTILVATDAGILRSTDGGATFNLVTVGGGGQVWSVQKLSSTEALCTTPGFIFRSPDAGATWILPNSFNCTIGAPGRITVATSPASGTTAYAIIEDTLSGNMGQGLLKTTDKGATWTTIAAPTATNGLFQAEAGDGGQGFYNHCIAVDPANINNVFVGSNLDFYRTTNGGTSWEWLASWDNAGRPYAHADFHCAGWSSTHQLFTGNDGGMAIFLDPFRATVPVSFDATFLDNTRNKGMATHLVYNLGSTLAANAADARYRISLGMQDNGTRIRVDDGSGLQSSGAFNDQIGGDGFGTVWHPTDASKVLGSIYYTQIYRSLDGGSSFSKATTGITEANSASNAPFAPKLSLGQTSTPDVVYTFTNPKVYKSTNFGQSWSAMSMTGFSSANPAGIIRNINASRGSSAVGIASNGGRFWVNYNGSSWTTTGDITGGTLNTSYIWFDSSNDQIIYGATVAPSSTAHHLYKSVNGGATWTFIDQTPGGGDNGFPFGIPVHVIQNDPTDPTILYAGTDFGVYRSGDSGSNWSRFGTGLPLVATRDLYVAPDGSFLRAATFGRGVWEISLTAPVVGVTLDKASATLAVGASTPFTATVSNTTTVDTAAWSATGGSVAPATTASGAAATYTAPATVGTYTLTAASVEDPTKKANATITVYDPATLQVSVQPGTANLTLPAGGSVTFTATVAGAPSNQVTWSANGGSITPGGVFTAATPGTYTVTATAPYSGAGNSATATAVVRTFDLNADAAVDPFDLLNFAADYGTATGAADYNGDAIVNDTDLGLLLAGIQ